MSEREREWARMVRAGENLTVEFKRQVPKLDRLAKSLSAFSNSSGGSIFFGVEDNGDICGLDHLNGTRDIVRQVAEFHCDPPAPVKTRVWNPPGGASVLVVEVPEAVDKPVYAVNPNRPGDAWPFFRSHNENLPLDRKSLKTMRRTVSIDIDKDIEHLDRHAIAMLNRMRERPRQTLNQLAKSANISAHRAKKILVNLEQKGWIHSFFNEKRREFSLAVPWKKK